MLLALFEKFNLNTSAHHYDNGDEVFQIGHKTHAIYYVVKGLVQLYRIDSHGNRIILHQAGESQLFAEASINSDQYHCTAQCIGDTELLQINIDHFKKHLKNHEFSTQWIHHLSTELRRQRASVERLNLRTAVEKVTHFISTEGNAQGEFKITGSVSDLAQVIGLSRESLYRTLSKMKKEQQLEQVGSFLRLL